MIRRYKPERLRELVQQIRQHNVLEPEDSPVCLLCTEALEGRTVQLCGQCWELVLDQLGEDFSPDDKAQKKRPEARNAPGRHSNHY